MAKKKTDDTTETPTRDFVAPPVGGVTRDENGEVVVDNTNNE